MARTLEVIEEGGIFFVKLYIQERLIMFFFLFFCRNGYYWVKLEPARASSSPAIHGGVITPDNSPIRHYGGVIYYTNTNPDIPCRNELRRRNAELP